MIGVPEAKAVLVNPEVLPVVELAVLVLDELEVLLDLLLEPQAVSTAPAITTAVTRLAVDVRERRGAFKRDGLMVESGLADACPRNRERIYPRHRTYLSPTRECGLGRRRRRLGAPIKSQNSGQF